MNGLKCGNCGYSGDVEIKKGVTVGDAPCPNCGNASLYQPQEPMNFF